MQLSDFDFDLPKSLIAQHPSKNRTDSRLLIAQSNLIDAQFHQIGDFIQSGDLLVMNNTKVIPARLFGHKDSGGKVEIMIERLLNDKQVLAMIRASRAPQIGSKITLENSEKASVLNKQDGFYTLEFATDSLLALLDNIGHIPLPPYIERTDDEQDLSRYQTVYAKHDGAVAAPTAGLHFDDALLNSLKDQGIDSAFVTLHVGAGTFQPVKTDNIKDHTMHSEYYEISQDSVDKINQTKANGGRIIAIGTTAVRLKAISPPKPPPLIMQGVGNIKIFHRLLAKLIKHLHRLKFYQLLALVMDEKNQNQKPLAMFVVYLPLLFFTSQ
jgi:S-adenosylmethionine:tRNA ribosyltransferase-isomerase